MTDSSRSPDRSPDSAGALLRAAREKQGLHIAALAAAIKVPPRKLEALESNRWDELHDATFARALAQTVCRTLKIDPQPVLELLPASTVGKLEHKLENVAGTLNPPFSGRGSQDAGLVGAAIKPMVWGGALLLLASLVIIFIPQDVWTQLAGGTDAPVASPEPPTDTLMTPLIIGNDDPAVDNAESAATANDDAATSATSVVAPSASAVVATVPAAAASPAPSVAVTAAAAPAAASAATPGQSASADSIQLVIVQPSWITARDASGQQLISRLALPGEQMTLEGALPISLVIGNAAGVQLRFRKEAIDLPAMTRDNVARLRLP